MNDDGTIQNPLVALRQGAEALIARIHHLETDPRYDKLAAEFDRLQAALNESRDDNEKLRYDLHQATKISEESKGPIATSVPMKPHPRSNLHGML